MAKLEIDQMEKFLRENCPKEQPSADVYAQLEKQAVWNDPPKPVKSDKPVATVVLLAVILATVMMFSLNNQTEQKSPEPAQTMPMRQPKLLDQIAMNGNLPEIGSYRFMTNRSDDFNLSFSAETSVPKTLSDARESLQSLN